MLIGYTSIAVFAFLAVFSFVRVRRGKKVSEYFEIIMNSLTKTIYSALGINKAGTDKALDKISFDIAIHDQSLTIINHKINEHSQQIGSLEQKVYPPITL